MGEYLLPPSLTGTLQTLTAYAQGEQRPGYRRDRVYLVTEREAAEVFAALHPQNGWLYRVQPEGALEADPGYPLGVGWACERALILEAVPLDGATMLRRLRTLTRGTPAGGAQ